MPGELLRNTLPIVGRYTKVGLIKLLYTLLCSELFWLTTAGTNNGRGGPLTVPWMVQGKTTNSAMDGLRENH